VYKALPGGAKNFLHYLHEKAVQASNPIETKDPGNTTTVTVVRNKGAADSMTLVENARGQLPNKHSLCSIFNKLEGEGFSLQASGGALRAADSELVFVFKKKLISN